jgi:hypothetical protein
MTAVPGPMGTESRHSVGVIELAEALHEHRTRDAAPGYRFPLAQQPRDYRKAHHR